VIVSKPQEYSDANSRSLVRNTPESRRSGVDRGVIARQANHRSGTGSQDFSADKKRVGQASLDRDKLTAKHTSFWRKKQRVSGPVDDIYRRMIRSVVLLYSVSKQFFALGFIVLLLTAVKTSHPKCRRSHKVVLHLFPSLLFQLEASLFALNHTMRPLSHLARANLEINEVLLYVTFCIGMGCLYGC